MLVKSLETTDGERRIEIVVVGAARHERKTFARILDKRGSEIERTEPVTYDARKSSALRRIRADVTREARGRLGHPATTIPVFYVNLTRLLPERERRRWVTIEARAAWQPRTRIARLAQASRALRRGRARTTIRALAGAAESVVILYDDRKGAG